MNILFFGNHRTSLLALTVFLLTASLSQAKAEEIFTATGMDVRGNMARSQISISFQSNDTITPPPFSITQKGEGAYDRFENVSWMMQSTGIIENDFLKTDTSRTEILDQEGKVLRIYLKQYNYQDNSIVWQELDEKGSLLHEETFPIKGQTADDTNLIFFVQPFLKHKGTAMPYFYLLTNEPSLYKTNIRFLGQETLDLPSGKIEAEKVKLIGDMGMVDDILDQLVLPTYLWYAADSPYNWLQYQGFEKGYKSIYIKTYRDK